MPSRTQRDSATARGLRTQISTFISGNNSCHKGSVRQLRGSFHPHGSRPSKRPISSPAFLRSRRRPGSFSQLAASLPGGASQLPPSSFKMASLRRRNDRLSQNPWGLFSAGGRKSLCGPRSSPQLWSRLAIIEVPERCIPAMHKGITHLRAKTRRISVRWNNTISTEGSTGIDKLMRVPHSHNEREDEKLRVGTIHEGPR